MPKVDFNFGPRRELEEPLYLDFVASRPPAGPRPEPASGAPTTEDRPLHLDLSTHESQRRRPATTYPGYAGDPAAVRPTRERRPVRGPRWRRGLLALGLTAIVGLGVAGALWSYPALERRTMEGGNMPAEPAPSASFAGRPAQVAAVKPTAEVGEAKIPAPFDTAAPTPSPALRPERLAGPAPLVANPERQEPRKRRPPRITSAGPEASAATARANIIEAYAPQSTLSAQSAAQAAGK